MSPTLDELQTTTVEAAVYGLCRIYLMKQIVRQYSMDILKQISDVRQVQWLIPQEAKEDQVYHFSRVLIYCALLNCLVFVFCTPEVMLWLFVSIVNTSVPIKVVLNCFSA